MALFNSRSSSRENKDTGFGVQPGRLGERFIRKDGSFNMVKTGIPLWNQLSLYSSLLKLNWRNFYLLILLFFFVVNWLFTTLYWIAGFDQLVGINATKLVSRFTEVYFFSIQTFTTVGYGRINPVGLTADVIASVEAMCGWLFFAMVTGLLYGRFTQPKAYIAFSDHALVSPYKDGHGLMFRMVPFKNHHHLTDAKVTVNIVLLSEGGKLSEYKFYELKLERARVDMFTMNWTVVHPIDEDSPLIELTEEQMRLTDIEMYVQVSGFDPVFSNTVMQRTSYTYDEIVWNARFLPMYRESPDGSTTIIELDKLSAYEPA